MSQFFHIHDENPQPRLIKHAVEILQEGGVIAYPTDSGYALGCTIGHKTGVDRIRQIRQLDKNHNFTLMCRDLSELSTFARVDNTQYRMLRNNTPGAYTFILKATGEVPKRLMHPKKRTIGIRIPDNRICLDLLAELGEPMMSSTLILPNEEMPMSDPYEIRETLEHELQLVIDGGHCGFEPSTVINLTEDIPEILRVGKGDPEPFE